MQMSDRRSEAPSLSSRSSSVYYNAHSDVSTLRALGQDRGSTKRAGGCNSHVTFSIENITFIAIIQKPPELNLPNDSSKF